MDTVSQTGLPEPAVPDRIGPYVVVTRLATGGMAELLLGRRVGPSGFARTVAIKRILPHLAEVDSFRDMFLDEARLAAMIEHPNVVRVEDLGEDRDSYYMAMEFLEGDSARGLLRVLDHPLDPTLAAYIVAEAAAGLHAAHSLTNPAGEALHVIHRDVSPHNIFLTYDGRVKVIDFGVARAAERITSTQSGVVKGKFAYMSPEQLLDQEVDHRSDQFSLGIVLHELLTRRRLFSRGSQGATVHAIVHEPVPPPSQYWSKVPPELDAICARALAKHPIDRYASCAELRGALLEYLDAMDGGSGAARDALAAEMQKRFPDGPDTTRALLATPADVSGIARRPARRHRSGASSSRKRGAVIGGALLLSALVGGALALRSGEGSPDIEPSAPADAPVTETVSPTAAPVFLEVSSEPRGATIVLPGEMGLTTPARIERDPSDEPLALELRLEGHQPWSQELTLDVSQRIHATLTPEPEPEPEVEPEVEPEAAPVPARRRRARRARMSAMAESAMTAIPLWD